MSNGLRTLVLGFDALDSQYLELFSDVTPTLSRLFSAGISAPLDSTVPPWTASAWPSMYTGTDPSHHGVYGFFDYDYPDEGDLVTRNDVAAPALWNYLTEVSAPSVVLNVPVTHPAEPLEGVLVPGYLAGEDDAGYPRGVREELSAALGEEYRVYSSGESSDDPATKLAGYLDLIDLRKRAAVELLSNRDWDLAIVQVQKTDAVFHNFDDESAWRAVYEAADDFAAAALDTVEEPCNVVVCSDHGMGRKQGYQIQLNDVLHRAGYLTATTDSETVSLGEAKQRKHSGADADASDGRSLVTAGATTAERLLSRVGLTPGRLYSVAETIGVEDILFDIVPNSVRQSVGKGVDWRESMAYCRSESRLGVRINLAGREPAGVVSEAAYETVRGSSFRSCLSWKRPTGTPPSIRCYPVRRSTKGHTSTPLPTSSSGRATTTTCSRPASMAVRSSPLTSTTTTRRAFSPPTVQASTTTRRSTALPCPTSRRS
ncbi:alkaline phosphatase family protein [Halomicroarcula sp. GCM10025894]|uniref:alkaline phosphatase family protein n=1 Tax=Halomicroarcula sp. GCM10025894 TaxID=3252673 RepID=UPI0036200054